MGLPWTAADAASTGRLRNAEWLEAEVRKEMARHAAIQARGFDSVRMRAAIHRGIDDLLDEWGLVS
jgi:hypothetical protein